MVQTPLGSLVTETQRMNSLGERLNTHCCPPQVKTDRLCSFFSMFMEKDTFCISVGAYPV